MSLEGRFSHLVLMLVSTILISDQILPDYISSATLRTVKSDKLMYLKAPHTAQMQFAAQLGIGSRTCPIAHCFVHC